MFLALAHMRKCNIMHADIKPDNILVTESKAQLKICDLGSASDTSENEITPYLVSRFYRAPEISACTAAMDRLTLQFSVCPTTVLSTPGRLVVPCTSSTRARRVVADRTRLTPLQILFPGRTNNHMLLLIQELSGRINTKTVKRSKFGELHFDELGNFLSLERNKTTGVETVKKIALAVRPSNDLRMRLMAPAIVKSLNDAELKMLSNFVDLLSRCLETDPIKRITPRDALSHAFLR